MSIQLGRARSTRQNRAGKKRTVDLDIGNGGLEQKVIHSGEVTLRGSFPEFRDHFSLSEIINETETESRRDMDGRWVGTGGGGEGAQMQDSNPPPGRSKICLGKISIADQAPVHVNTPSLQSGSSASLPAVP